MSQITELSKYFPQRGEVFTRAETNSILGKKGIATSATNPATDPVTGQALTRFVGETWLVLASYLDQVFINFKNAAGVALQPTKMVGSQVTYLNRFIWDGAGWIWEKELANSIDEALLGDYPKKSAIYENFSLVGTKYPEQYYNSSGALVAFAGLTAIDKITVSPGEILSVTGTLTATKTNATVARYYNAAGAVVSSAANSAYVVIGSKNVITVPSINTIVAVGFYFASTEVANIDIYRGIGDKPVLFKESQIPSKYLTDVTGVARSLIFDINTNLITTLTSGAYSATGTNYPIETASRRYTNIIKCTAGESFAFMGLTSGLLTQGSMGRYFDASGTVIGTILAADLIAVPGGYILTVPAIEGLDSFGMHFNTADSGGVIIYRGTSFKALAIKLALLPDSSASSTDTSNVLFRRGHGEKIYVPTLGFGIACAGQSQIDDRVPGANFPTWFVSAGYQIADVMFCNNDAATFATYSKISTDKWSFDLPLYKKLIDYLKAKNAGYKIYSIKNSLGGTAISTSGDGGGGYWTPYFENIATTKIALLKQHEKRIRLAKAANPNTYDIRVLLFRQGEADRNTTAANKYKQNCLDVINYYRGIFNNPKLLIILYGVNNASLQYSATVNNAKIEIAAADPYVKFVPALDGTAYMQSDTIHDNAAAAEDFAEKTFQIIKDLEPSSGVMGGVYA